LNPAVKFNECVEIDFWSKEEKGQIQSAMNDFCPDIDFTLIA